MTFRKRRLPKGSDRNLDRLEEETVLRIGIHLVVILKDKVLLCQELRINIKN